LTTLTHAFANTVQNFLLEATLRQHGEQRQIVTSGPHLPSVDDHHEGIL
jgi:hypothetical protein